MKWMILAVGMLMCSSPLIESTPPENDPCRIQCGLAPPICFADEGVVHRHPPVGFHSYPTEYNITYSQTDIAWNNTRANIRNWLKTLQ
jgi:hypothetical protein